MLSSFQFSSCSKIEETEQVYGCECEDSKNAETSLIVSLLQPEGSYSTYDYSGVMEADAACHAGMSLSFRWTDSELAQTQDRPPLYYEFQSLFGYFPTNLGMESVAYDGDAQAYVWVISISQAIDKDTPEGSSYGIYVKYLDLGGNKGLTNIKCDISISYKVYDENAYKDGCMI